MNSFFLIHKVVLKRFQLFFKIQKKQVVKISHITVIDHSFLFILLTEVF